MRKTSVKMIAGAAALAVAAALSLPALAAAQEAKAAPPAPRDRPARMAVRGGLGLTPEQEKALEGIRKARLEERTAVREEMAKIRTEMRELAKDPQANQGKLDALIDRTAKLRAEREKAAFRDRIERDKVLTPEQRERLEALRQRLADRPLRMGRGALAAGRSGFGRPGRLLGPGDRLGRLARARALRHRPLIRRWRDR